MTSLWRQPTPRAAHPPLDGTVGCDVCVVGGGIAGLLIAYRIANSGYRVILLERDQPGAGETLNTTAHLSFVLDRRFHHLEGIHGRKAVGMAIESHARAIDWLGELAASGAADCEFERLDGYLIGPGELLSREMAVLHEVGWDVVQRTTAPASAFVGQESLRIPRQALFHPGVFLDNLVQMLQRAGGKIYGGTTVQKIERAGDHWTVTGDANQHVNATAIVRATNSPIRSTIDVHLRQVANRSYVIAVPLNNLSIGAALFWDTEEPYHYVRPVTTPAGPCLLIGGEDHRTGTDNGGEQHFAALHGWAQQHFPGIGDPVARWSGQILEPSDGLAFIGALEEPDSYLATGFSGNGMTYGAIAAMIIADQIDNKPDLWAEIYHPQRSPLRATAEYLKGNAGTAAQYASWVTPGDVSRIDEIPAGSGAVVRQGLRKVAVFRNRDGKPTRLSAVCPHLDCIVKWNSVENTWDCPCHGSRFDPHGKVLNGPAVHDLKQLAD